MNEQQFLQDSIQNLRVWSRRMGVAVDIPAALEMAKDYEDSLVGPLTAVFYHVADSRLDGHSREFIASEAAGIVEAYIRRGVKEEPVPVPVDDFYPMIMGIVKLALETRRAEKYN